MTDTYTCPTCGAVSYNPKDAQERYCGRCSAYEVDKWAAEYRRLLKQIPDTTKKEN